MDASFTKEGARYKLLFHRTFNHPPEKVWRVLTERDLIVQWFPCDVEGGWKAGDELKFTFLHGEGEGLPEEAMRGEVLIADEPHTLEFRWGEDIIRCELSKEGDGCKMVFWNLFDNPSWGGAQCGRLGILPGESGTAAGRCGTLEVHSRRLAAKLRTLLAGLCQ